MSREDDFKAILVADTTPVVGVVALLPGGIYTSAQVGVEGITRDAVPAAYSGGYLLPCALIVQQGRAPTGDVRDYNDLRTSARQRVQIYLYQDAPGYAAIDAASARIYTRLQGQPATGGFEISLVNELDRGRDQGPLAGASMIVLDFEVVSIIQ